MARLRIAQAAQKDLREIRIHSKRAFGPAIAKDYLIGIRAAFTRLRDYPLSGSTEDDLGIGLRGLRHRSHRIFYRVQSDTEELVIVRILHHSRDAGAEIGSGQ